MINFLYMDIIVIGKSLQILQNHEKPHRKPNFMYNSIRHNCIRSFAEIGKIF